MAGAAGTAAVRDTAAAEEPAAVVMVVAAPAGPAVIAPEPTRAALNSAAVSVPIAFIDSSDSVVNECPHEGSVVRRIGHRHRREVPPEVPAR